MVRSTLKWTFLYLFGHSSGLFFAGCVYCTGAGTNEENRQKLRKISEKKKKKNCTERDSNPSILACKQSNQTTTPTLPAHQ